MLEPTFTANDNPAAPLVGILKYETDVPASAEVTVTGGDERWTLDLPSAATVEKAVAGLKPDTEYAVTLKVSAGENVLEAGPLSWTTPPLPDDFPPIQVNVSVPEEMEPGMTMYSPRDSWAMIQAPIIIVDSNGVVRWYFKDQDNKMQEDLRRLKNGNFLFGRDFCNLREVDIRGKVVGMWHAANYPRACDVKDGSVPVPVVDFHHETAMTDAGNFLVISSGTRTVEGYPTSEDDPDAPSETALILDSSIVEFTREGEIVKEIRMADLLDTTRVGRDSLDTQWPSNHVPAGQRARDWDHANAVIYDEASDSYYVSLRNQDAVIKINRTDETLTWILGTPANWVSPWQDKLLTPEGDLLWPFHQHAVELTPLGIGLYDNGNYRAAAFEPYDDTATEWSRVVIYDVDETAMTVKEVWHYGEPDGENSFFCAGMGDADWQPETGNVLITNAELVENNMTYAQLLEVTPSGDVVFDMTVRGDAPRSVYAIYRAEHLADIRYE